MRTKFSRLLPGRMLPLVAIAALVVVVAGLAVFLLNGPLRGGANGNGGTTQQCGTVHLVRGDTLVSNPDEAGRAVPCFAQAYTHCEPATLTVTRMGIDAFTTETFTLAQSSGSCAITDAWSSTVNVQKKTGTEHCAGLTTQADAILIRACGTLGDRKVPEK